MEMQTINVININVTDNELATIIRALEYSAFRASNMKASATTETQQNFLNKTCNDCNNIITKLMTGEF